MDWKERIIEYIRKDSAAIIILLIALLILAWTYYANQTYAQDIHQYYQDKVDNCGCQIDPYPTSYSITTPIHNGGKDNADKDKDTDTPRPS